MKLGIVERLKAVVVVLDLRPFGDSEAQSQEYLYHRIQRSQERMLLANPWHSPGQGYVNSPGRLIGGLGLRREVLSSLREGLLEPAGYLVSQLPPRLSLLHRQLAQALHYLTQFVMTSPALNRHPLHLFRI